MSFVTNITDLLSTIIADDLYKNIYNKFIYLPINETNVQIILSYYPEYYCNSENCLYKIKNESSYDYPNTTYDEQTDTENNVYYYRTNHHLYEMFQKNYYDYITLDSGIKLKNYNPIQFFNWGIYRICPTLDPAHNNHLMIIAYTEKDKPPVRAHLFYFPDENINLFKDMIDFSCATGYYVYNSIELGSIPEMAHFHTSTDKPFLINIITYADKKILCKNNGFTLYKINDIDNICENLYYFEVHETFLDKFVNLLPKILYSSRYYEKYKYMSQVFVCSKKNEYIRVIVTFRKVDIKFIKLEIKNNSFKYVQEYYDSLFGNYSGINGESYYKIKYNMLGYNTFNIYKKLKNNAIDENEITHIKNSVNIQNFKNYCKNIFTDNKLFENHILEKMFILESEITISSSILKYNSNLLLKTIVDGIKNALPNFDKLVRFASIANLKYENIYDIDTIHKIGYMNKKIMLKVFPIEKNLFEINLLNSKYAIMNNSLVDFTIGKIIYLYDKRMVPEIFEFAINTESAIIISNSVKTTLRHFIEFEKKKVRG